MQETFLVSARKYRPTTFRDVVGQNVIVQTLKNAILQNKVAQSFLFTGPRGVGKTTCARIFAKTINCENITPEGEACNECKSCQSFNNNTSFNIYELDAASNNSVEDIRQLIEQVRIPPQDGKYKIYIIDEVHMLSAHAFNAFLKTLEEPPAYAKFILATTERHKILPTILSRCQVYHFKRISVQDMVNHLQYVASQEGINVEEEALRIIALRADGAMRDALFLFDQMVALTGGHITYKAVIDALFVLDYDFYFQFSSSFLEGNYVQAITLLNDILAKGFDGSHLLSGLTTHIRYLLLAQTPSTLDLLELGSALQERYQEHSKQFQAVWLIEALNMLVKAEFDYRQSNIKNVFLENLILQLCLLHDRLQKNFTSQTSPPINPALQTPIPPTSPPSTKSTHQKTQTSPSSTTPNYRPSNMVKINDSNKESKTPVNTSTTSKPINETTLEELKNHLKETFKENQELSDVFSYCTISHENEDIMISFSHPQKKAIADKYKTPITNQIHHFFDNNNIRIHLTLTDNKPNTSFNDMILQKNPEFQKFVEILSLKPEK